MSQPPLWSCPRCGRTFANRNQSHTCAPAAARTVDDHLRRASPATRDTYARFVDAVERQGPVTILVEKTRIAFHVRMSFAAVMPRPLWLDGHLVLARRIESPRFTRIETFSPRNHLHAFRLVTPDDVDAEFTAWIREAYDVGEQRHLQRPG